MKTKEQIRLSTLSHGSGWACKIGPDDLTQVLGKVVQKKDSRVIVGYDNSDDAAVIRLQGDKFIIQTVDFFTPIVDDPYMFGQIAAANSISDIYAMGGKPLFALNILGFPVNDFSKDIVSKILQGGADKASEAGISIVGGHSIDDKEPKYGLVVTGEVLKDDLIQNKGSKPGDVLLLTKPLGTGIISTGIKKEKANPDSIKQAEGSMATLNKLAGSILSKFSYPLANSPLAISLLASWVDKFPISGLSFGTWIFAIMSCSEILSSFWVGLSYSHGFFTLLFSRRTTMSEIYFLYIPSLRILNKYFELFN